MQLIDFESEEDWENEAVSLFMKNNKKLLKYLFDKYVSTCYSRKIVDCKSLKGRTELLTLGELTKMYRDHKVNLLSHNELGTLMRLVNDKFCRNEFANLTFEGFQEYFAQSAIYAYSKPGGPLSHLPLVETI